jgi:hypothetical protein
MNANERKFYECKIVGIALTVVLISMLQACTSTSTSTARENKVVSDEHLLKAQAGFESAAVMPLNDLHLVHAEIPPVLVVAQKAPYAAPENKSCDALSREIFALDTVLGQDLDVVSARPKPELLERGTVAVGKAAIGAFRGITEGVVPYRRWVRKLSGAERYSKEVDAAIAAGLARRSFIKGMAYSTACEIIALPMVEAESQDVESSKENAYERE